MRGLPLLLGVLCVLSWPSIFPLQIAETLSSLCFEKISDEGAIYLQEHPGRNRAVMALQSGELYLMSLPAPGSGRAMAKVSMFLNISERVNYDGEMGFHSFAFHPAFASNGRFFVTYTCDSSRTPDCLSNFGCVPPLGCTPSTVTNPGGPMTTVIAEYRTLGPPTNATRLLAKEMRRILSFARPHTNHHGGHLFFGKDGFLYFTSGDGGSQGDPWNLAQNIKSSFGKILRMDVNKIQASTNYSIPRDNPFQAPGQNPLVFALGLRNPWRCDQDPVSGTIACGDVGGSFVEEVDVIRARGNYGWRNFEGGLFRQGSKDPQSYVGNLTLPTFSYNHSGRDGFQCIIGGVFYRSGLNPCLQGKYLYSDLDGPMWVATLSGTPSTSRVNFICATNTPLPCPTTGSNGSRGEWGQIYSWNRDVNGNAYVLSTEGIFRAARLSSCMLSC